VPGATQEQIIKVVYEASEAEQAARARSAAEQKRIKDEAKLAKATAKEVSDAQKTAANEAADAAKKAAKEASEATKKAAKEAADAQKKAAAEMTDAEKAEAKKRADVQALEDRRILRDYQDRVRKQVQEAKALASEEAKAAIGAQKAKEAASVQAGKAWDAQNASILASVKSVGMFAAGMVGLNSATAIMSKLVEHFNAVRMASILSGEDLIKYAKELRSLGALEGNLGAPEKTLVEQLAFRQKTLQTPGAAAEMTQKALASAQGAIDSGLVKKEVMDKFLVSQGQLQTMLGESPAAIGTVAGSIPMMLGHKDVTLEEMQAMSEKARLLSKGGGFESYEQAAVQLGKVMPWVTSGMLSMPEAMTLLGVEAHGGQGAEAGTRIDELMRMTSMGRIRAKHMKLDPSVAAVSEVSSEYMKRIGIKEQTSPYQRAKLIAEDLMKQDAARAAKGERFNAQEYLGTEGQINQASNFAAMHMYGQMKIGAFEPLEKEAMKVQDPQAQTKAFEQFVAKSPTAQAMRADIGVELVERVHGLQAGQPWQETMMRQAYASLGPKKMQKPFEDIYKAGITDPVALYQRSEMEHEAQRMILLEARRTGFKDVFPDVEGGSQRQETWRNLQAVAERTAKAGGQMVPDVEMSKQTALLEQINEKLGRQTGGGGPPKPVGQPVNPVIGQHIQAGRAPVPAPLPARPMNLPGRAP